MIHRRRTKIVVTLGPALDNLDVLKKVINAGADVFRCNFSHGSQEDHQRRIESVRKFASDAGREVAIFADLQGPKIRVARFKNKKVFLKQGDEFVLDANLDTNDGDEKAVGIDYKELPHDVTTNDILLLDDGRIVLCVKEVVGVKIICSVVVGGELSNNKGINRQGGGLSAKALTDKDKADLVFATTLGVDYFAISFPRSAADMEEAKSLIVDAGSQAGVIAKIERVEAVAALEEIINASDAIMVARGDLGVEIGDAELPAVQKHIIKLTRQLNKPVITATQMMESMIHNSIPTRAEVFDVANAVLDNTDAVMLSAESASGDHPDVVVEAMARICSGAEKNPNVNSVNDRIEGCNGTIDEAIAMAAMYTANNEDIKAIIAITESGHTPLLMSRVRTDIPIFALTRNLATQRKVNLYRGVYPLPFDITEVDYASIDQCAIEVLQQKGILQEGDLVIVTKGDIIGEHGHTNTMKIWRVE